MCCTDKAGNIGLLLLRIAVGVIFIYHGWQKLTNMDMVLGMFANMGFPAAAFWAYLVAIVEFLGGIAVLLGLYTRIAAGLLAIIMLVALLVVHIKGPFASAELAIALLGATLALWGVGGGAYRVFKRKAECCCRNAKAVA